MIKKSFSIKKDHLSKVDTVLAEESALQILVNNIPFTITMRSPQDDIELIYGILYTEGVIENQSDIIDIETIKKSSRGVMSVANVVINQNKIKKKIGENRQIISVSSCGLCGKRHLDDIKICGDPLEDDFSIVSSDIPKLFAEMGTLQTLFKENGGTHAASIFNSNLELISVKEDVGRHNAVDKCIGELIKKYNDAKILIVSGRVSYEIISKTYMAKIPIIAAVSAATSLAVQTAEDFAITLLAFCRDDRMTILTNEERIVWKGND